MHISQPIVTPLETIRQPFAINAEQMQDRRLPVVDVDGVLDEVATELVCGMAGLSADEVRALEDRYAKML